MQNIRFKRFDDMLTEAAQLGNKLNLVVMTNTPVDPDSKDTPQFLIEKAVNSGMNGFLFCLKDCSISDPEDNGNITLTNKGESKGFVINKENTVIIARRGVVKNTYTRGISSLFESNGFFCINSLSSILDCENKYLTAQKLEQHLLPTPRTALVPSIDSLDDAIKKIGGKFPVILKTLSGSQGIGVSIIDSEGSLKSVLQTMWKLSDTETLIQEKIDSDYDIRIQVLTKRFDYHGNNKDNVKIIGYMRRNRGDKKDFRTNHSLGGSVENVKLTEEQINLAVKAADAMGCHWCGVDIIVDDKSKKNYILEVNASPGTKGIKKVIGKSILQDIIDFIKDKSNWSVNVTEIGYMEVVNLTGFGEYVAKFDSGNGTKSSSVHADKMTEKNGYLNWSAGNKKMKSKIVGYANAEVGDTVTKRPIIELDIKFRGIAYSKMHFSVVDRSAKSTPMLINRELMEKIGVVVNPQKTFVVSGFDGKYDTALAKSDKTYGIKVK